MHRDPWRDRLGVTKCQGGPAVPSHLGTGGTVLAPALSRMPGSWVQGGAVTVTLWGNQPGWVIVLNTYAGEYGQPSLATVVVNH